MIKRTRFAGNKLARDKTLERCKKNSVEVLWRELSENEHIYELKKKLVEEAEEVLAAKDDQELLEELADIQEVLKVLMEKMSIVREDVEKERCEKECKRGSFYRGLYIEHFDVPLDSHFHDYYSGQPDKYPVLEEDIEE